MKKILLSIALVAMSVFSMSALSFKVEVNGVEVKDGDTVEITELVDSEALPCKAMVPHMKLTNLTANSIDAIAEGEFTELADAGSANGASMIQFCFDNCYTISSEVGVIGGGACKFAPNEVREGIRAHIEYMPAYKGDGFWEVEEFLQGVSVFKFTLRNSDDASDAITFNIKFNYKGENAIDGIEVDSAAAEYYNFQGVKVANPEKGGMYIVRRGAKVSKEIVK
ncbi:MAG: hypothetical protein II308_00130 [Muribaculaceae bacterium]|nr:hypothetical protein [Muribaculaceae bacterium]